jgi:chromosome segregation ATPase
MEALRRFHRQSPEGPDMSPTPQSLSLPAGEKMSTDDELVKRLKLHAKGIGLLVIPETCTEAAARIQALTAEVTEHEEASARLISAAEKLKVCFDEATARATAAERERDDLKRRLEEALGDLNIMRLQRDAKRWTDGTLTTEPRS